MKVFTSVVLILLFILIITAAFGILQFDQNRMIPHLEKAFSSFWGSPVKIGSVSVKWDFAPRITVRKVKLYSEGSSEPVIESENGSASFDILPLFSRRLVIHEFDLEKPTLNLKKSGNFWNLNLLNPPEAVEKRRDKKRAEIRAFRLNNARIQYSDESEEPRFQSQLPPVSVLISKTESAFYTAQIFLDSVPANAVSAVLHFDPRRETLSGQFKGPFYDLSADITSFFAPALSFQARGSISKVPFTLYGIEGFWTVSGFEAAGEGLHPELIKRSLLLKGDFKAEQGKVRGLNLVRQILDNLSPIPGFIAITREEFPGILGEIYKGDSTPFEKITGSVRVSEGRIEFEELFLEHPLYKIQIHGSVNFFENRFDFKGAAVFLDQYSRILLERAESLDVLLDPENRIVIPFTYSGRLNQPNEIAPDLHYIANRLVQFRGEQLASRGIQKINDFLEVHR